MIYRTKKITVRLTDKEYAKLREMSETSGLKMEPPNLDTQFVGQRSGKVAPSMYS